MILGVALQKQIIKAATTKSGATALKRFAEKYGMKEYVVAGKLLDWFGEQDDVFQRAVMGMLSGLERDAAREFMRRLGEPVDVIVKGTPGGKARKSNPAPEPDEKPRAQAQAQH